MGWMLWDCVPGVWSIASVWWTSPLAKAGVELMTFYVYNMMEELLGTVTATCWEDAMDKVHLLLD